MSEKAVAKPRMSASERRAAIIKAAIRLFAERGFRGTTTRELAAAVGVTEPVLYEHFRTKRDLYTAIIDEGSKGGAEILRALVDRYSATANDREFFLSLAELILRWYSEGSDFIRLLLFSGLEGHELKDLFYERQSTVFLSIIADYIEKRMRCGALRPMDPVLAARAFLGMAANYAMSTTLFRCAPAGEPKQMLEGMVDIYLGGISNPNHTPSS